MCSEEMEDMVRGRDDEAGDTAGDTADSCDRSGDPCAGDTEACEGNVQEDRNGLKEQKENEMQEKQDDLETLLMKEKELKERYYGNWLRTQADFDNYRKRSLQEREELKDIVTCNILGRLLPVVDNLERALAYAGEDEKSSSLHEGIRMVHKQILQFLEQEEVRPIDALGKEFDPRFHEAVMSEETEDVEENTVVDEFQKGYTFKDRVLRPSMVKVAKRPD